MVAVKCERDSPRSGVWAWSAPKRCPSVRVHLRTGTARADGEYGMLVRTPRTTGEERAGTRTPGEIGALRGLVFVLLGITFGGDRSFAILSSCLPVLAGTIMVTVGVE